MQNKESSIIRISPIRKDTAKSLFETEELFSSHRSEYEKGFGYPSYLCSMLCRCWFNKAKYNYYHSEIRRTKKMLDIEVFKRFLVDQYQAYYKVGI
mmetsp:Transcript_8484/g.8805  ORF Transcript_8484/g.8805 Transcript_8484/m.8805 type:complete len:96 (+) Transcript_8484:2-289(+)